MGGLRENIKKNQGSLSQGRDLNRGPQEHDLKVLNAPPRDSGVELTDAMTFERRGKQYLSVLPILKTLNW
jgi:hypothetical protein